MALDRRSFLTFVAGGAVGTLFTPVIWKSIDDTAIWTQNWSWIPRLEHGPKAYAATTCKLCPAGCGLNIRTAGDRPVVAEGRTDHPLSQGGICPLGAAAVQMLYSPARIKGPMKKQADGTHQLVSWEEAEALLLEKLNEAKGQGGNVACISGDENSTMNEVLSGLLAQMDSNRFFLMPGESLTASKAFGSWLKQGVLGYDLENADLVMAFGADLLDSWGTAVRNKKAFGAAHPIGEQATTEYVYVGPMQNTTGAVADKWVSVAPGLEGVLALGIAYHLLQSGMIVPEALDFSSYRSFVLSRYTPEYVSKVTGLSSEQVAELAVKLRRANRPVVVPGSAISQGNGVFSLAAVMSLNFLLHPVNSPGGIFVLPDLPTVVSEAMEPSIIRGNDLVSFVQKITAGKTDRPSVFLVYEANPVHGLPQAEAMSKVFDDTFLASFSTFYDETAARADLILPTPYFLERWDDVQTPHGAGFVSYSVTRPVIKPLFDVKPAGDVVLGVAEKLGLDLGFSSFEKVLEAKTAALAEMDGFLTDKVQPWQVRTGASPAPAAGNQWRNISRGAVWTTAVTPFVPAVLLAARELSQAAPPDVDDWAYPVRLASITSRAHGSRHIAIPPFCLPLLGEEELQGKTFYVRMNSTTARNYGLKANDRVKLVGPGGECVARVRIFEGVGLNVVAAPLGFGHTAWDEFSRGKGDNIYNVLTVRTEPGSDLSVWADSRVRIAKAY
ncbi:MAG TPA: molybdopterin oxidoreductase [Desulfonatronum sp.]|nr:molybdopterin oxidoreductase [Desulfonatronum sp.]